jgi:hypothetical protein
MSVEYYVKRAQPQYDDIVVLNKIASVEDNHLETDVHTMSSGRDAIDRHEVLRGPSVG